MIEANTELACEVAAALRARDLNEVTRIVNRANFSRVQFGDACVRLGFGSRTPAGVAPLSALRGEQEEAPLHSGEGGPAERAAPAFFLDAQGPGDTTALILATLQNDHELVRRLLDAVSGVERYRKRKYLRVDVVEESGQRGDWYVSIPLG